MPYYPIDIGLYPEKVATQEASTRRLEEDAEMRRRAAEERALKLAEEERKRVEAQTETDRLRDLELRSISAGLQVPTYERRPGMEMGWQAPTTAEQIRGLETGLAREVYEAPRREARERIGIAEELLPEERRKELLPITEKPSLTRLQVREAQLKEQLEGLKTEREDIRKQARETQQTRKSLDTIINAVQTSPETYAGWWTPTGFDRPIRVDTAGEFISWLRTQKNMGAVITREDITKIQNAPWPVTGRNELAEGAKLPETARERAFKEKGWSWDEATGQYKKVEEPKEVWTKSGLTDLGRSKILGALRAKEYRSEFGITLPLTTKEQAIDFAQRFGYLNYEEDPDVMTIINQLPSKAEKAPIRKGAFLGGGKDEFGFKVGQKRTFSGLPYKYAGNNQWELIE